MKFPLVCLLMLGLSACVVGDDGISATSFYGVDATITDWVTRNNVTNQAVEERIGASTVCRRYATPADGTRPSASSDTPLQDFNANAYLWVQLNP